MSFRSDGLNLFGTLYRPPRPIPPVVLGLHGLFSDSRSPKQLALARRCCHLGLAYFCFDHRGCGCSEGEFEAVTSLTNRCRDLFSACEALARRDDLGPGRALFGSSMGGAVCLAAAARLQAAACVTIAAPIRSRPLVERLASTNGNSLPAAFFHNRLQFDLTAEIPSVRRLFVVHGSADAVVPLDHGREIYRRAAPPKQILIQPDGDHRMSVPDHQRRFLDAAGRWFAAALSGR